MNRLMISLAVAASMTCTVSVAQSGLSTETVEQERTAVYAQERAEAFMAMLGLGKESLPRLVQIFTDYETEMAALYTERDAVVARIDELMASADAKVIEMLGEAAQQKKAAMVKAGNWQPSLICCEAGACAAHAKEGSAAGCAGHAKEGAAGCCAKSGAQGAAGEHKH
jgi:hypothetical protein